MIGLVHLAFMAAAGQTTQTLSLPTPFLWSVSPPLPHFQPSFPVAEEAATGNATHVQSACQSLLGLAACQDDGGGLWVWMLQKRQPDQLLFLLGRSVSPA